jgi:hypothetical protein
MKALTVPGRGAATAACDHAAASASAFAKLAELTAEHVPMIALLARSYPAIRSYADPTDPETPWVTVFTSVGQLSWPIKKEDLAVFEHVPFRDGANLIRRTAKERALMLWDLAERVADDSSMVDAMDALL